MKLFFSVLLVLTSFLEPNLLEVRKNFVQANDSKEISVKLHTALESVTKESKLVLVAYKGAANTLMAKHSKGIKQKKGFFKEGVMYLEFAIEKSPKNIEIRCLRLSVQEHSPKILKYKKNIKEDKQFLIDNFKKTTDKAVKKFVKDYVLQSSVFDDSQKKLF